MTTANSPWWQGFADTIAAMPEDERPLRLARLAQLLYARGEKAEAAKLSAQAWTMARRHGDTAAESAAEELFPKLTAKYHAQIATNDERITAWMVACTQHLRPGMRVLEIGTGSGVTAMLAARTGAEVISCDPDPIIATIAADIVARNGFSDRIRLFTKPVEELAVGPDLAAPADVLMMDLFSGDLFGMDGFNILRRALPLLRPDAQAIPGRVSLHAALADYPLWARFVPSTVCGFDLSPLQAAAPTRLRQGFGETECRLRSEAETVVDAILPHCLPDDEGESVLKLVSHGDTVNGVVAWLRLELAPGVVLEAKPGTAKPGFYVSPLFYPFARQHKTLPGESFAVRWTWAGRRSHVQLI